VNATAAIEPSAHTRRAGVAGVERAEPDQALHGERAVDPAGEIELGDGEHAIGAQLVEPGGRCRVVVDVPAQRGARDREIDSPRSGERGLPRRRAVVGGQPERGAQHRPAHVGGEPQGVGVGDRGRQRLRRSAGRDQRDPGARRLIARGGRAADRHHARHLGPAAPRGDDLGQPRAEVIGVDQHDIGRTGAWRTSLSRVPGRRESGAHQLILELNAEPDIGERDQHRGHHATVAPRVVGAARRSVVGAARPRPAPGAIARRKSRGCRRRSRRSRRARRRPRRPG
jgi:hypothetical protein